MTPPAQKKKDLRIQFNEFLDEVFKTGPSFSMENLARYEKTALESRELKEATPRKSDIGELVFKRVKETRTTVSRNMTARALNQALALGEQFEMAKDGKELNLKKWVEG